MSEYLERLRQAPKALHAYRRAHADCVANAADVANSPATVRWLHRIWFGFSYRRLLRAALWLEETGGVPREWIDGETPETEAAMEEFCAIVSAARRRLGPRMLARRE